MQAPSIILRIVSVASRWTSINQSVGPRQSLVDADVEWHLHGIAPVRSRDQVHRRHGEEGPLAGGHHGAGRGAAPHLHLHQHDVRLAAVRGQVHPHLAREPRLGGRAPPGADHGHGGRRGAERAHGQQEHAAVVVADEQQPRRRHGHLEPAHLAVVDGAHRHGVGGAEVGGEVRRRADEGAAVLRAAAGRVRAGAPVLVGLVVGDVPVAAGVGALYPGGGHHGVQRGAGVEEAAAVRACPALPGGLLGRAPAAGQVAALALQAHRSDSGGRSGRLRERIERVWWTKKGREGRGQRKNLEDGGLEGEGAERAVEHAHVDLHGELRPGAALRHRDDGASSGRRVVRDELLLHEMAVGQVQPRLLGALVGLVRRRRRAPAPPLHAGALHPTYLALGENPLRLFCPRPNFSCSGRKNKWRSAGTALEMR
uniref:Uncharacterized protein n=1 Tax=Aegilops tauschii subsp. strangulata TaxID=200361 RepID=A0A453DQ52_AEGTS